MEPDDITPETETPVTQCNEHPKFRVARQLAEEAEALARTLQMEFHGVIPSDPLFALYVERMQTLLDLLKA